MKAGTQDLHTTLEKRRRLAFVLFTVPFLLRAAVSMVWGRPNDGFMVLIMLGIFVGPVILYFAGLRWCRYLIGLLSLPGGFFGLLVPMVMHAHERTVLFWLLWIVVLTILMFTALMAFAREPAPPQP